MSHVSPASWLVVLALSGGATAAAQRPLVEAGRSGVSSAERQSVPTARAGATVGATEGAPWMFPSPRSGTRVVSNAWWIPVTSAIVPGAGQLMLRQDRALAYVVLEAFVAALYVRDRQEAQRQREAYRDLARTVARSLFAVDGVLLEGDFEYYERMEKYVESGVYDLMPGGPVDPESDETTFNGSVWRLARETFWSDPRVAPPVQSVPYQRALAFYTRRAVRPAFRWSWRNAQLEHDLYVRTIDASNQAFRRTIADLGALLANHTLSAVDAYVTLRLRWRGIGEGAGERDVPFVEGSIPWAPFGRR